MTNLINKVLDILETMEGIETVLFDNGHSANVRIDRKPTPAALLYTLPDWTLDIAHGTAKERATLQVFFFEPTKLDVKAEDKLEIFENTNILAKEFIYRLLSDSTIKVLDDVVNIKAVYGEFDKFVCGCTVELTLEEKQASCIYTEPTPEPEPDENEDNEENQG